MSLSSARPPEKQGTEDDEKKDPTITSDNRRTDARDKASSIHRMAYVAVRTRCHQFMPLLGGDGLAPVLAELLPRPHLEGHASGAHNDTDTTYDRVSGGEVEEVEYRKMRKQERGDNGKQEAKTLQQVPLGVLFYASCGNDQVYDEDDPESIDEPDKD